MAGRDHILEETNWKTVAETPFEVAVLPWGATEAHNYHLPYGTDTLHASQIAAEAARLATEEGASVVVLPAVPFGVQTGQLDIPFCLNVNPSTQASILGDLVDSLEGHGVTKLVVLNGHGGNDFKPIIREVQTHTELFLCAVNWWTCVDAQSYFDEPGDHAGELETSVMLHLAPQLVLPLDEAGPGAARPWRIAAFREGWAWAPRRWSEVTDDTGVGDPHGATAEKGAAFVRAATERIAEHLVELDAVDPDDLYDRQGEGWG